jgi:hypothetical protein
MTKTFNLKKYVQEHKTDLLDFHRDFFKNIDKIKEYEELSYL